MNIFMRLLKIALKNIFVLEKIAKLLKIPTAKKLLKLLYLEPEKVGNLLGSLDFKSKVGVAEMIKGAEKGAEGIAEQVKKQQMLAGREKRKVIAEEIIVAAKKQTEKQMLSSSWIISGKWDPDPTGSVGDLTIETKSGGIYTYPGVPFAVWNAMKKATGQNGSGAGTIFWALYLRNRNVSAYHFKVSYLFKMANKKVPNVDPKQFFRPKTKLKQLGV